MSNVIDDFRAPENRFLGNFHECYVEMDGVIYPTVEHAFQAAKTFDHHDRETIRGADSPRHAKRIGRSVDLRSDWDDVRVEVMKELLVKKFETSDLRKKLLATRDAQLVSGGDSFWGMVDGMGLNQLGKLLMEIRAELMTEAADDYQRACREFLLAAGWTRDMDGDVVFDECWTPPWDDNCQFDLFSAVQHQRMEAARIVKSKPVQVLADRLMDSLNDDGTIKPSALKDALKDGPVVVQGEDPESFDIDDFRQDKPARQDKPLWPFKF
jgi:ribA/ribD-fused uncharacterized protein